EMVRVFFFVRAESSPQRSSGVHACAIGRCALLKTGQVPTAPANTGFHSSAINAAREARIISVSAALRPGAPAQCPQSDSRGVNLALGICFASVLASSAVK